MPNFRAQVLTPWVVQDNTNQPQLPLDHPVLAWQDVTGQPAENIVPDPNTYTIEVTCDQATLDAISADAAYFVLTSEEIVPDVL